MTATSTPPDKKIPKPFEVMTAMTAYYVARWASSEELLALRRHRLALHYGWTAQTIERFRIGFDDGQVVEHLKGLGFSREEILSTGAFRVDSYNTLVSRFVGRIVFPYLDKDRTTLYFVARQTPMTPPYIKDGKDATSKYLKTKVHDRDDDGISPLVKNVIWQTHEPGRHEFGIIAEGIPDAVSAAQAGYPVVSPVTTVFKAEDAPLLGAVTQRWAMRALIPDQEANGAGMKGAMKTGLELVKQGCGVRLVVLPHETLKSQNADWKIDLNEFLAAPQETRTLLDPVAAAIPKDKVATKKAAGAGICALRAVRVAALARMIETAKHPLDHLMTALPDSLGPADFSTAVRDVTNAIALVPDACEREAWLAALKKKTGASVLLLRKMLKESSGGAAEPNGVTPVLSELRYFRILTGRAFTTVEDEAVPVDGKTFLAWVSHRVHHDSGAVVSAETVANSVRAIVGPTNRLPQGHAPIRYAYDEDGSIWIDLADRAHYVHVTADGARVVVACPVKFYRPDGTLPMPMPDIPRCLEEAQASLAQFWELIALDPEAAATMFALMMSSMRPMERGTVLTRYPVGVLSGEHGGAKSSRQTFVRRLIDPREPALIAVPDKIDDLIIHAENTACISLENVSDLWAQMSDALCRISTGAGKTKRELYYDRDQAVFRGSVPILINGIGAVVSRDDLLDRSLVLHLKKPPVTRDDDVVEAEFCEIWPRVFGALLWCMSAALHDAAETKVDTSIRMQQAARWAAAAEEDAGFPKGSVERSYLSARSEAAAMAAEDPAVSAVVSLGAWRGEASELLQVITEHAEARSPETGKPTKKLPPKWPTDPRGMRALLDRKREALRQQGRDIAYLINQRIPSKASANIIVISLTDVPQNAHVEWATLEPGFTPVTTNGVADAAVPFNTEWPQLDDV